MFEQDLQAMLATEVVQSMGSRKGAGSFVGQPCLVLATGGIGHRIALALKALLVSIFGAVPAGIRILALDIDEESLSVRVGEQLVTLERDVEFFCLGPVPVSRIRYNLNNLPTIRDRLPGLQHLPFIAAARAAQQLRPLGQLAFQWQFPRIHALVRDAIWTLAGRDQRGDDDLVVDPGRGIKIIQVGSNCGGTNSGMFIDLGYLVRYLVESLGILGEACDIIGIGMLPGAFRGVDGPNLVPNTVASLLELEAVAMNGHISSTYRDGTVVETTRPPFDMYLLVDAVDEGGRVWINRNDLCNMVARAILVLVATGLGDQSEGELENLYEVLGQVTPDGHGTFFGSLGLSVLEFPAEAIVEFFAAYHGQAVINAILQHQANAADVDADARSWLQTLGFTVDGLLSTLAQGETGLPLAIVLEPPASLRRLPELQVPQEAIQFVQAFSRLRLDGDYRSWVRQHAETRVQESIAELETQMQTTLNDPRLGPVHTLAWLQALRGCLNDVYAALSARRERVRAEETRCEVEVKDSVTELIQAPEAFWLMRRGQVTGALDRYLQVSQAFLVSRLDGLVLEQAVSVVAALTERVRESERQVATLETHLAGTAAHLAQQAQEHARRLERRRGHVALNLLDETYLEQLYRSHAPDPMTTLGIMAASSGTRGFLGWSSLEPEAVAELVVGASRRSFEPIQDMTIEDVVQAREGFSPEARLAALQDEARPAWNLDETRLPGGDASLKRITVVGVPDRAHSVFRSNGNQLVSLHDPHNVVALCLTVGAPYTALQAWPDYLAEYERVRRLRPLHTLPAFQVEEQESGLALALGLIFGQVYSRGVHFYYQPADELAAEIRLAQGAANARQALAARQGLIHELMERIAAQIEHIGVGQALDKLMAYCTPAAGDDELARELKRLVRDYAETLQANARVAGGRV
jgi:hypothetical protein